MISLDRAKKMLFGSLPEPAIGEVLIEDSIGYVLAEDLKSDVDMPPFNKSAVDGYACNSRDTLNAPSAFTCIGSIEAGSLFGKKPKKGDCAKIMTGAAVPDRFNSVIMIEDTAPKGNKIIFRRKLERGVNISRRGEDLKKGAVVLKKGKEIQGPEVMVAASLGRRKIKVYKKPLISVLNTGNEIVNPPQKLSGNKIFNSNGPLLVSLLKNFHIKTKYLGIAKDREPVLYRKIRKGLEADMLIISGGVSVGDYDLVPLVLNKAGVRILFHTIKMKPGKPILFGKKNETVVFGLPGNPNSNFLACLLFIVPAIKKLMGFSEYELKCHEGFLDRDFYQKTGRTHFVLIKIKKDGGRCVVSPVKNHGSADVPSLSGSDGFMIVDENSACVKKDARVEFITWKRYE
jgi:molybdopterin molybdotransferase